MNIEQIERQWQQRAHSMTLDDVEAELKSLPTQPKTDNDLIGRATMARRRLELIDASRPGPNDPPPDPAGMVEVFVPEGGACCVQSRTLRNKFFYAENRGGRAVIKMPWTEFCGIAFSTVTGGAGPNGGAWLAVNPHLANRFPTNPPPPMAAPPQ